MSRTRRILIVGCDPRFVRETLSKGGFNHEKDFEIIEVAEANAGVKELQGDDSIAAAVVPGLEELEAIRTSERGQRLPVVVHSRHYRYELFRWDDVTRQTLVGDGHELLRGLNELLPA